MAQRTVVLLGSLAVVGFALSAAAVHAPRLEARLAAEAAAALAERGLDLEARPAGRHMVVQGVVSDAAPRRAAGPVAPAPGTVSAGEPRPAGVHLSPPDRQAELDLVIAGRRIDFRRYGEALTPQALSLVADVAAYLARVPGVVLEIAGHSDSRGDLEGNYEISRRRAEAVRRALMERGVVGSRLLAVGRGPERPIADNATAAGRQANRRVELLVVEVGD